jgi:hypothetical protein
MRKVISAFVLGAVALSVGCYHATIETGLQPNGQVITQKWATSWVHGLVPPKTVNAAAQCPNGVAKVETQLSFVNQLVTFLTFGIFSPMQIDVSCAGARSDAGSSTLKVGAGETVQEAVTKAADAAVESGKTVYLQF